MKKLIADITKKPDGSFRSRFYCQGANAHIDRAVSHTLLMLIAEATPPNDVMLEALIAEAEAASYVQQDASLPDWGVNDKNLWLVAPMAEPGHICISNENTSEFSTEEGGVPPQFTYQQFRVALEHWRKFQDLISLEGKETLVGRPYEATFPE